MPERRDRAVVLGASMGAFGRPRCSPTFIGRSLWSNVTSCLVIR